MKPIMLASFLSLTALLPVQAAPLPDQFLWRQYLSPSDWKGYDTLISNFTEAAASAAVYKIACDMPVGVDTEEHFLDPLTGMNLIRRGLEATGQKKKFAAWLRVLSIAGGRKCDLNVVRAETLNKQRWQSELLELEVRGLENKAQGGRTYR